MLDLEFIVANPDAVRDNAKNRNIQADVDLVLSLADDRKRLIQEVEATRRRQNDVARSVKGKLEDVKRRKLIDEGRGLKEMEIGQSERLKAVESRLREEQAKIPNITHPNSPIGKGEEDNIELRRVGEIPKFDFQPRDHVELAEIQDLIDFKNGAKVAGRDFYFLKNEAVLLEFALVKYAFETLIGEGFTPFITPDLASLEIIEGLGYNPRGAESQIYDIEGVDLGLIATAEITLGGLMKDEIIPEDRLPLQFVGYSHCYRRESGAPGRVSKGLYRVHQFSKVEMFIFTKPEDSDAAHEYLLGIEESIFHGLGIPYRVVECCTGDLGGPAYRKFDLEAWMPGRGENGDWGEITSVSNCTDYQARRLNVRFRPEGKKPEFVHMLNGTAIAISRALLAILENYQQADGTIVVPEALRAYMGKDLISR